MLDKKVIKFTRNGIQQENLATGDTKMLTQSKHGKELKYTSAGKEQKYGGKKSSSLDQSEGVPVYRPKKKGTSPVLNNMDHRFTYGRYNPSGNKRGVDKAKYYYTAKVTGNKVQTHADLRGNALKHIRSLMIRKAGNAVLNDMKESDNAALEAISTSTQSTIRINHGFKRLHSLWNRNSIFHSSATIKNTEFAAAKNTAAYKAAYARKSAARAAKTSQETAKQASEAVRSIGKFIIYPATIKMAAIVGAMLLVVLIITQSVTSVVSSVVGSVSDHPELTAYVMQLDADFQDKINSLKESYNKEEDTDVNVDGEDLVNTDPNALAILATGDWTVIDLTPENKEKLSRLHATLNTYTVTKTNETKQATSSDGTAMTKTIHHIAIKIIVYTAQDKIDSFGFSEVQKNHVLQKLEFLNQINTEAQGNISGIGGNGSVDQGEFIWAVPGHTYISSGYGIRIDPINGQPSAFHTGLDIPAPVGTPVVASANGTVIRSGVNGGFGNCVIIQHRNGIQTLYGHNSALLVKVGDVVKQGQVIAKVGQTGRATGPHSHFEFRINGKHVNPVSYLQEKIESK